MAGLDIIHPGMLTLIQDLGRFGVADQGLSQGGAIDLHASCWANYLVGNEAGAAVLEITLGQAEIRFQSDCLFAVTGAAMPLTLDGEAIENWQCVQAKQGQTLKFGYARSGLRAYLAVRGGLDLPLVLGSRSAVVRNQIGGLKAGQPLAAGDRLHLNHAQVAPVNELAGRQAAARFVPDYAGPVSLRVVESYQHHAFHDAEKARFYSSEYTVSQETDRMGCRLSGPAVHPSMDGIISEGIALGAIQIPPNGQPIVLFNDRQTLGGYPKIGCVARMDLPRLAQARPGTTVTFRRANLDDVQQEWIAFSRFFGL
ncbi:5-oxoprolinase subunit C family protein [Photobacterium ganghwense]|uniref:5-oxoprolinase subunit C family protein n=1 Tax=Photobacterium ganghwense TaxID=320778 RepID=UPI001C2D5EA9|nr:biotin-dependent carboxyltransferase family protein [Photobacterium ganghwense]MBV1841518.1 biotin-dependent carboxyltransferase family protein [Photobacterium ganghwense]